jgi:hypothetical protein
MITSSSPRCSVADGLGRIRRAREQLDVGDLRHDHVALVVGDAAAGLAALARFLLQRADVALQALVALHRAHDVVVVVEQRRRDDLALVGVAVAAERAEGAAAEERRAEAQVGLLGAALRRRDLHRVRASASSMLVCASLNLRPPATAPSSGLARPSTPPSAPPTPPALPSENTTFGGEDEVRRDHLALAHVRARTRLARGRELALLHRVLHADAALDDDEAVGLLDHHAQQADRRAEAVATQRGTTMSCGSTTAIAPIGLSHFSTPLSPVDPLVPAARDLAAGACPACSR